MSDTPLYERRTVRLTEAQARGLRILAGQNKYPSEGAALRAGLNRVLTHHGLLDCAEAER